MKKITAVILSVILILAMAVPAFAEDVEVLKAEAKFDYPKAGDTVEFKPLTVDNPEEYSAKVYSVYYFDKDSNVVDVKEGDTYTDGIQYHLRIKFTANPGYKLAGNCEFWVNGEKQLGSVGTNLAEISFKVAENGSINPATGLPFDGAEDDGNTEEEAELNLFQRIIAFFVNLFEKIRLFFSSLFPKV